MLAYRHNGFSVDTSVCIAAHDRAGLERSLRYCARPPFAMKRLRKAGGELVYRCAKQHSEPGGNPQNKRGSKVDEITLAPLELIDCIAALVPPSRHPPPPQFRRAGASFVAPGCCHGDGSEHIGASAATGAVADRASQQGCR